MSVYRFYVRISAQLLWANNHKPSIWMVLAVMFSFQQTANLSSIMSVNFTLSPAEIPAVRVLGFGFPIFLHFLFMTFLKHINNILGVTICLTACFSRDVG